MLVFFRLRSHCHVVLIFGLAVCLSGLIAGCVHSGSPASDASREPLRSVDLVATPSEQAVEALDAGASSMEKDYIRASTRFLEADRHLKHVEKDLETQAIRGERMIPQAERDLRRAERVDSREEMEALLGRARRYERTWDRAERSLRNFERAQRDYVQAKDALDAASWTLKKHRAKILDAFSPTQNVPLWAHSENGSAAYGADVVEYYRNAHYQSGLSPYSTHWSNAEWVFQNSTNREAFLQQPEVFAPAYGGYCAWAMAQGRVVPADPDVWAVFDNRLYLHAHPALQAVWKLEVEQNVESANAFWHDLQAGTVSDTTTGHTQPNPGKGPQNEQ